MFPAIMSPVPRKTECITKGESPAAKRIKVKKKKTVVRFFFKVASRNLGYVNYTIFLSYKNPAIWRGTFSLV